MQVLFSRQTGGYSTVSCPCQLDRKEGEEPAGFPRDCGLCLARVSAAGCLCCRAHTPLSIRTPSLLQHLCWVLPHLL